VECGKKERIKWPGVLVLLVEQSTHNQKVWGSNPVHVDKRKKERKGEIRK
jgi:hypothetical protein